MKKAWRLGRSDGGCRGMADARQGRKWVGAQVLGVRVGGDSGGVNCGQCGGRRAAGLKLRLVRYSGRRSVGPYCRGIGCASGGGAVAGQMCVWAPFGWPVTCDVDGLGMGPVWRGRAARCGGGVCGCGCARARGVGAGFGVGKGGVIFMFCLSNAERRITAFVRPSAGISKGG